MNQPKPGYLTPRRINPKTGQPYTIPSSAKNAEVIDDEDAADLFEMHMQQFANENQVGYRKRMRDAAESPSRKRGGRRTRRRR
jgi:hypothetical protein